MAVKTMFYALDRKMTRGQVRTMPGTQYPVPLPPFFIVHPDDLEQVKVATPDCRFASLRDWRPFGPRKEETHGHE